MKKFIVYLLLFLIASLLTHCAQPEKTTGWKPDNTPLVNRDTLEFNKILINLPSCIANISNPNTKLLSKASLEKSIAFGSYAQIRDYIGLCQELANLPVELARQYNTYSDTVFRSYGFEGRLRVDTDAIYKNSFHVWNTSTDKKVLELSFNKYSDGFEGYMTVIPQRLRNDSESSVTYTKVEFNTRDAGSGTRMKVSITNAAVYINGSVAPVNIVLDVSEKNGILTIKGGSYHLVKHPVTGTQNWCYIFRGKADTAQNKAVFEVAVPPAVYTDSTSIYDSCSVYYMVRNYVLKTIDTLVKADTTNNRAAIIYASVKYNKKIPADSVYKSRHDATADTSRLVLEDLTSYRNFSTRDSVSYDIITAFLSLNREALIWSEYWDMLDQGSQPVYFSGAAGYAGHGVTPPAGFTFTAADVEGIGTITPAQLANLSISFSDTSAITPLE